MWADGAPTEQALRVYTYGDCWALAWHLARAAGGQVALVARDSCAVKPTHHLQGWVHAVAKVGHDLYLDVRGRHDRFALLERWDADFIAVMSPEETPNLEEYERSLNVWPHRFRYDHGHAEAERLAATILDHQLTGAH